MYGLFYKKYILPKYFQTSVWVQLFILQHFEIFSGFKSNKIFKMVQFLHLKDQFNLLFI